MSQPGASSLDLPAPVEFNPAHRLHLRFLVVMAGIISIAFIGQVLLQREFTIRDNDNGLAALAGAQQAATQRLCHLGLGVLAEDVRKDYPKDLRGQLLRWKAGHDNLAGHISAADVTGPSAGRSVDALAQLDPQTRAVLEAVE